MSPEEAGEEILAGRPYETCNLCQGRGVRQMSKQTAETASPKFINIACTLCFKKGNVIRPLYHVAAKTLGLPIPPQPLGAIEKREEAPFDWKELFWNVHDNRRSG